jgi:hypothetical protein
MDLSSMPRKRQHPPSFYCPISQQCMHDPVVLSDGHSYERKYIERWLETHRTSPVSGLQLPQGGLYTNHALRNAIEEYFQEVFSEHRQAIWRATKSTGSSESLLRTIDSLMQCSLLMNADLSTECILRRIMDEAKTLVGAEVASVFLVDSMRKELYSNVNSTEEELRIPITAGIAGHVATTGEPVIIKDAYHDVRFNKVIDLRTGFKTRNMMCVPLKVKKGAVIGVVQLINKVCDTTIETSSPLEEQSFTEDDIHFLEVFASQAASAVASSGIEAVQSGHVNKRSDDPRGDVDETANLQILKAATDPTAFFPTGLAVPEVSDGFSKEMSGLVEVGQGPNAQLNMIPTTYERGVVGTRVLLSQRSFMTVSSAANGSQTSTSGRKRSGRTRQRKAKFWASVRQRTPSGSPGYRGALSGGSHTDLCHHDL